MYTNGLLWREFDSDPGCDGIGGTSSGELSKRATKSRNEAFFAPNDLPPPDVLRSRRSGLLITKDSFLALDELLELLGPRSSCDLFETTLDRLGLL